MLSKSIYKQPRCWTPINTCLRAWTLQSKTIFLESPDSFKILYAFSKTSISDSEVDQMAPLRPDFTRRINNLLEQEIGILQNENERIIEELQAENDLLKRELSKFRSKVESSKKKQKIVGFEFNAKSVSPVKNSRVNSLVDSLLKDSLEKSSSKSSPIKSSPIKCSPAGLSKPKITRISPIKLSPRKSSITSTSFSEGSRQFKEIPDLRSKSLYEVIHSDDEVPFHMVPTQYSDDDSQDISKSSFSTLKSSPKKSQVLALQEVIENSEDEEELKILDLPKPHTTLQRRDYLQKHYIAKFKNNPDLKVNLSQNPINELRWIISDFKQNPNYKPIRRKVGMTKQQENNLKRFHLVIGEDIEDDEENLSQMFDKFPSPPGFMNSEFPSTQEQGRRRHIIEQRQKRRIERRIIECLSVSCDLQVGEFVFVYEILNEFVKSGRYTGVQK